jgi:hypothetical protein
MFEVSIFRKQPQAIVHINKNGEHFGSVKIYLRENAGTTFDLCNEDVLELIEKYNFKDIEMSPTSNSDDLCPSLREIRISLLNKS